MGMNEIKEQVLQACEVIGSTYGPNGNLVLITPKSGKSFFTRDGVTVAKNCDQSLPGVGLVVDACDSAVRTAGDGTTTTALLIRGLLANGIVGGCDDVVADIRARFFLPDEADMVKLCSSVAHDKEIGEMIGKLIFSLGGYAHITSYYGKELRAYKEEGYAFSSGALLPQYMMPPPFPHVEVEANKVVLYNPHVLLIEEKLHGKAAVRPVFEKYLELRSDRPLLVIIGDMDKDAAQFALANFFEREQRSGKPNIPAFFVKSPLAGRERFKLMEDMAFLTGSELFSGYSGKTLDDKGGTGNAMKVEIYEQQCIIHSGRDVEDRIEQILADDTIEEDFRNHRVAMLSKALGKIELPSSLHASNRNLEEVIQDTVLAAQNAVVKGAIVGGKDLWSSLAEKHPNYAVVFNDLASRLPATKSYDAMEAVIAAVQSAFDLNNQLQKSKYAI